MMGPPMMGPPMGAPPMCGPMPCPEEPRWAVAAYVGYVTRLRDTELRFGADEDGLAGLEKLSHRFTIEGLSFAAAARRPVGCQGQVMIKGSWLFPFNSHSREEYTIGGLDQREWKIHPQWWNLDASAAYLMGADAALLGGFRFDSFQVNFVEPYGVGGFPAATTLLDRADFVLTAYQPYVGIGVQRQRGETSFSLSVIGFPHVFGDIEYRESRGDLGRIQGKNSLHGGWFMETTLEANYHLMGSASVGGFMKFHTTHGECARTKLDLYAPPTAAPGTSFRVRLDRETWTIGLKSAVSF
jgi:hypothetical protein